MFIAKSTGLRLSSILSVRQIHSLLFNFGYAMKGWVIDKVAAFDRGGMEGCLLSRGEL
jgi:hypothetical protein